jgi:2,3-diketo-5-methylthio-1-phosphopentane phosphatase
MKSATAIFCDFDGTISRRDVGYALFHHFSGGRNDSLLPAWKNLQMSSRECLSAEAAMVSGSAEEIHQYLAQFDLDHGFAAFEQLCVRNEVPVHILSDGLDLYINQILHRNGLGHLPVMSNIGRLNGSGLEIEFPWDNTSCTRCGCCKGERMAEYRAERTDTPVRLAFVGDGYSDICAVREADLLLAKKDLAVYCTERKIPFVPFDNFADVSEILIDNGYLRRDV